MLSWENFDVNIKHSLSSSSHSFHTMLLHITIWIHPIQTRWSHIVPMCSVIMLEIELTAIFCNLDDAGTFYYQCVSALISIDVITDVAWHLFRLYAICMCLFVHYVRIHVMDERIILNMASITAYNVYCYLYTFQRRN